MRDDPTQLAKVERKITARPTAGLQAYQQQAYVDPNSDRLVRGLASFVDTVGGIQRHQQQQAMDSQAVTADLGLRSYQQAWKAAVETDPAILDDEEKRRQWDEDARSRYFADVTHEEVKGRAFQRLDALVNTDLDTHKTVKAAKYRADQATQHIVATLGQIATTPATDEQRVAAIREEIEFFQTSPSYSLTAPQVEQTIRGLVDSVDRNQAAVLSKAYMDDPKLSAETQLFLKAKYAEATATSKIEHEQFRSGYFQETEQLIERGQLTWDNTNKAVEKGIISASEERAMHRRQKERLEAQVSEKTTIADVFQAWQLKDIETLEGYMQANPGTYKKAVAALREMHLERGMMPQFFDVLGMFGEPDKHTEGLFDRAMNSRRGPVTSVEEIPQAWRYFFNEYGKELYNSESAFGILTPQKARELSVAQAAMQYLGMSELDVYNLQQTNGFSHMVDINNRKNQEFQEQVRQWASGWFAETMGNSTSKVGDVNPNDIVGAMSAFAMLRVQSGQLTEEAAFDWVKKQYQKNVVATPFGPVPRSMFGHYATDQTFVKRLTYAADQILADQPQYERDDLSIRVVPDGRILVYAPDKVTPLTAIHMTSLQDPAGPIETARKADELQQRIDGDRTRTRNRDTYERAFPNY